MTPANILNAPLYPSLLLALFATLGGCASAEEPERWASLLEESSVFVGSLLMRCGEGPEEFEYSNSTLEIPVQLALAIDGRRLSARARSLAEDHPSPPADLSGRLESDGAKLSLAGDGVFEIGSKSLMALRMSVGGPSSCGSKSR